MDDIQKLYADFKRRVKHERSSSAAYDGKRAAESAADYFASLYTDMGTLPEQIADYWIRTRILNAEHPESEPSEQHIAWLLTAAEILDGTYADDAEGKGVGESESGTSSAPSSFSERDWRELCDMVNYEAEELPMDRLSALMSIFVAKKIL